MATLACRVDARDDYRIRTGATLLLTVISRVSLERMHLPLASTHGKGQSKTGMQMIWNSAKPYTVHGGTLGHCSLFPRTCTKALWPNAIFIICIKRNLSRLTSPSLTRPRHCDHG